MKTNNGNGVHDGGDIDDDDDCDNVDHTGASDKKILTNEPSADSLTCEFGPKSQQRLSLMLERCVLCQVLIRLLNTREGGRQQQKRLLLRYLLMAAPATSVEDYPRLPPVLSLCVVEALLKAEQGSNSNNCLDDNGSGMAAAVRMLRLDDRTARDVREVVDTCAVIWKTRSDSSDNRITDICRVELAAYDRIRKDHLSTIPTESDESPLPQDDKMKNRTNSTSAVNAFRLICEEEPQVVDGMIQTELKRLKECLVENPSKERVKYHLDVVQQCAVAARQLEIRKLDDYRQEIGSGLDGRYDTFQETTARIGALCEELLEPLSLLDRKQDTSKFGPKSLTADCLTFFVHLFWQMGNARRLDSFLTKAFHHSPNHQESVQLRQLVCSFPVVRFINLERRKDRRLVFTTQALSHDLLVTEAIPDLTCSSDAGNDSFFSGNKAFDGIGSMLDFVKRIDGKLGSGNKLSDYVESKWRPSDLKAFDSEARTDDELVPTSPTEQACALSHVSSWIGARRCLERYNDPTQRDKVLSGFRISGFAKGKALFPANEGMDPAPICLILEDDAMLVDRFADRLAALLEELPRDFHFCSIGYSRPRTAPLVSFSSQLGIPSCIWYLTGYIVSLEGCRFLLDSLPVKGPVDSWIGLLMCYRNWDNDYGHAMGVGSRTVSTDRTLSRKELCQFLRFRAFASVVPLCSQRVNIDNTGTNARRSWRQNRDTDITFSGHL